MKSLLSSGLMLVVLLMMAPLLAAQNQQICSNQCGVEGGFSYELWQNNGSGSACMTLKTNCQFSCHWNNCLNVVVRRGLSYEPTRTHGQIGTFNATYECDYQPAGNSYLGIYGWTVTPLVEFYVVDSWGSWRPPGKISKGTVVIDGGTYDIYEATQVGKPSINGTQTFKQYWSVRTTKRTSGPISLSEHFAAWEGRGMPLGKMYEACLFVEGYRSSGKADFTSANMWVDPVSSTNNPGSSTNKTTSVSSSGASVPR
jgi:hypothetical protein